MRAFRVFLALCGLFWGAHWASPAAAQDGRVRLMSETIPFTDVVDAADGEDPFDMAAHFDFTRTTDRGTIRRQRTGGTSRPVADHEATRSELMLGIDLGLYKDLMATFRMPVIISDERSLTAATSSGRSPSDVQRDLQDAGDVDADGNVTEGSLFQLADGDRSTKFRSPTRAGLDYIGLGFGWGVINQMRNPHLPTLVFLVEGRVSVGEPMHPCQKVDGKNECGNNDDTRGDFGSDAGSSRGVNALNFETRMSHRYRYVEPYGAIGVLVQWPNKAEKYFRPVGDVNGYIHRLPSHYVKTQLGAVFIPWENRARYQRFGIDFQTHGTYVTEGHDYSALFDALGTSSHAQLATPLPEGNIDPSMGGNRSLNTGNFYGLTDIEAHFRYGIKLGVEMRAAEYVRFQLGSTLNWVTGHALTSADPCNPNASNGPTDPRRGKCSDGIINPHHRAVIDLPGRRFLMSDQFIFDVYFGAVASF